MQRIEIGSEYMRSVYSRMLSALGIEQNDYIITERTLRLEAALDASKSSYTLNIKDSQNGRPLEQKLNQNDSFVISHIGMAITKQDTVASPAQYANFPLFTHPDPNFFVGASGGDNEWHALECLYNGSMTLNANNTDVVDKFNTFHFRYVPERGYLVAAGSQVNDEYPQYGPTPGARGLYPYAVNVILNGQDNNTVEIAVGDGDKTLIAGGVNNAGASVDTSNVLVVLLHGFEISQYASIANARMKCV